MTYESVTSDIKVAVTPRFMAERSDPETGRYFWAYTVAITNMGQETVRLRSRYWRITDGYGRLQEVSGPGVVGEEPVILPGESFEYTSGCPLGTPSGFMVGHYTMEIDGGGTLTVAIPAFSLDMPDERRVVN